MHLSTMHTQNTRVGTCPHGLPMGACPICNGMSGGGSVKKADFSAKPGEMSWNECAAIGAFLKAQKAAQKAREADFQAHIQALQKFQATMANAAQRTAQLAQMVQNSMPPIFAKPLVFVMNNIFANGFNMVKNLPQAISNFVQNFSQKFADISDKLAAVYGELKAAVQKKVSEAFKDIKKKIKSIFGIFETTNTDDEDKKIDEAKRTFELKTFIHKLYKKLKDGDNDERESI